MKPSNEPSADELRNKNINQTSAEVSAASSGVDAQAEKDTIVEDLLASLESQIDNIIAGVSGEEAEEEEEEEE
jgi:hypothetical protein